MVSDNLFEEAAFKQRDDRWVGVVQNVLWKDILDRGKRVLSEEEVTWTPEELTTWLEQREPVGGKMVSSEAVETVRVKAMPSFTGLSKVLEFYSEYVWKF